MTKQKTADFIIFENPLAADPVRSLPAGVISLTLKPIAGGTFGIVGAQLHVGPDDRRTEKTVALCSGSVLIDLDEKGEMVSVEAVAAPTMRAMFEVMNEVSDGSQKRAIWAIAYKTIVDAWMQLNGFLKAAEFHLVSTTIETRSAAQSLVRNTSSWTQERSLCPT